MKQLIISLSLLLAISTGSFSQENSLLKVGEKAPMFKAVTDKGKPWVLKNHLGKKNIILYFYPAAMTGGCTKQACAYRNFKEDIKLANAIVVGISGDNIEGLTLFRKTYDLNFTLLSDEDGKIARKFGVVSREGGTITTEVNGEKFELARGNTAGRTTFIIGKNGKIIYVNDKVDAKKDVKDVLEFLRDK